MTPAEFAERLIKKYGSKKAVYKEIGISPTTTARWLHGGSLHKSGGSNVSDEKMQAAFDALKLSDADIKSLNEYVAPARPVSKQDKPRAMPRKIKPRIFIPKGTTHTLDEEPIKLVRRDNAWFGFEWIGGDWRRSYHVENNMRNAVSVMTGRRFAV
ncbi:hypothetical protein KRX19_05675 [Cardiobacteriaceae bacterium TAE3-ERU3]|nr:hypothetical protein [Cardiobacteriaceae bacterium TAE3-ERU3]